jgi:hypothetical protein
VGTDSSSFSLRVLVLEYVPSVFSTFSLKVFVNICNLHKQSLNQPGAMATILPESLTD